MKSLRAELTRIAQEHPETRKHLVPLLQRTAGALTVEDDGDIAWSRKFTYEELAKLVGSVSDLAEPLSHRLNDLAVTLSDLTRDVSHLNIRDIPADAATKLPDAQQLTALKKISERAGHTAMDLGTFGRMFKHDLLTMFRKW